MTRFVAELMMGVDTLSEDLFSPDEILNIFTYNYRFNV